MASDGLTQFEGQRYLNLETYKMDGTAVRTPMWFAEHLGRLYVYTLASAWKVKRIRNNPRIRVVPSNARGTPRGDWVAGEARFEDDAGEKLGHRLIGEKYGVLKRAGDIFSRLRKRKRVVISIEVN